ncbi:MAG: response regulator [Bryobacteraceae bacterium]|jgi:CheY-like chemotaxis protein
MKTILMLEDEPAVMRLMRHMLKQYALIEATTAEQAYRLFTEHGCGIDLLVADLTLPTGSGIRAALLLRAESPDLPVILTSGYPVGDWSDRDCADLERLGPTSAIILQKPIRLQVLLETVRELIGEPRRAAVTGA